MDFKKYAERYLEETAIIAATLDIEVIQKMFDWLVLTKENEGQVFIIGVGGGAGSGSHAANDFMKIAEIPTICLSDNVSVLTALANDEGIESIFVRQMEMHHFCAVDCLFVYSVGGGGNGVSQNIVAAVERAIAVGAPVLGVVGRENGHTAQHGTAVLVVPEEDSQRVTAHTEDFQLIIDHLLVNALKEQECSKDQ